MNENENKVNLPEPFNTYANIIGIENLYALSHQYGGERIYIPKQGRLELYQQMDVIKDEYNGHNITELSIKYQVTRQTIYNYINK